MDGQERKKVAMTKIIFNATYDIIFKGVFSRRKPAAAMVSILENKIIHYEDITYLNKEFDNAVELKVSSLDVRFSISDTLDVDMEMQKDKPKYDMKTRLAYYLAQQVSESIPKGSNYTGKECFCICFLNYTLFEDTKCVHRFMLKDEDITIEGIKLITIELTKKENCDNIELKRWLDLLTTNELENYQGGDEAMKEAAEEIERLNKDKAAKERIRLREKGKRDILADKLAYYAEGEQKGIEKGREEGLTEGQKLAQISIAKKLQEKGFSITEIMEMTGITESEINQL